MVVWRQSKPPPKSRRQRPRRRGVALVVGGCVLFGAGVIVGALLGPLARPKTASTPSAPVPAKVSKAAAKKPAPKPPRAQRSSSPGEKLTFFKTLKEGSPNTGRAFVPFKPAGEAPPPLEALVTKKPVQEVRREPPPSPETSRPKAVESRRFYVHVAEFQFRENASRLTWQLRQQGYQAFRRTAKRSRKPYQVRVGPYASRREASGVARRLKKRLLYPTAVVSGAGS